MAFLSTLSTKERYGLRLALAIAKTFYDKKPISLAQISKSEKISVKYLEQLIPFLKKNDWIKSTRGREGGYLMIKDPAKISLKDFVKLFNETTDLAPCLSGKSCPQDKICISKKAWITLQIDIEKAMDKIKFSQLLAK